MSGFQAPPLPGSVPVMADDGGITGKHLARDMVGTIQNSVRQPGVTDAILVAGKTEEGPFASIWRRDREGIDSACCYRLPAFAPMTPSDAYVYFRA